MTGPKTRRLAVLALLAALAVPEGAGAAAARGCLRDCRRQLRACMDAFATRAGTAEPACAAGKAGRACRRALRQGLADDERRCRRAWRRGCRRCCRTDTTCFVTVCGDGTATPLETCDDGNAVPGDGCEVDCRSSPSTTSTSLPASVTSTTATTSSTTLPPDASAGYVSFESGQVRPLALSADGSRLFAVNTPDARLEIFDVTDTGLVQRGAVPVGLEPVAVAARTATEAWVVNHLSDSVSVVDVGAAPPRVVRTLLVGDEPRDVVFAGPGRRRAFITTAHRGQNSPVDPAYGTAGVGRADVWVFDAANPTGSPPAIVTLFGDTPRALAVSPDGNVVYVAVFLSGNRTASVPAAAVCDGGDGAAPCEVEGLTMPGGLPAPNANGEGFPQPEVGLIARYDPTVAAWLDSLGRDWNAALRFTLPDLDVFALDATVDPPAKLAAFAGAGTVLYGLAVNPTSGRVYVANTEARNEVRFAGGGVLGGTTVRGHLHESRITVIEPATGAVTPRHLNPHIDYLAVPSPPGIRERSLAIPVAVAVEGDGRTLYVAALGSDKIGIFDTAALERGAVVPDAASQIAVGGGPTGLVLDEARGRLYVLTRFDDAVAVVDTRTRREIQRVPMPNPEPPDVVAGRRFLYDARFGSSNGEAACASCHVFGDVDGLGWDLGDPDGPVVNNPLRLRNAGADDEKDFHPLKGPMTTQTLRGIATHGSMHWRGDRTGGNDPAGDPDDEVAAFAKFDVAFDQLLGRASPPGGGEMDVFGRFVLALAQPPNAVRALDNSLDAEQLEGERFFFGEGECVECHVVDPARGFFGTDGAAAIADDRPQFMKIPHLRNLYQKVGRGFGTFSRPPNAGETAHQGDQIRGFGFTHDGAAGSLTGEPLRFLMAFVTDLAPIVGQQVTFGADATPEVVERLALLIERSALAECDLVAKGVVAGEARGWYRTPAGTFQGDRAADPPLAEADLRVLAAGPGQAVTYTCVPTGSGVRMGVDRDGDGTFDGDDGDPES